MTADTGTELHAKTLLTSIDNIGKAADAIDEAAEKLAQSSPSSPPGRPNGSAVTPK